MPDYPALDRGIKRSLVGPMFAKLKTIEEKALFQLNTIFPNGGFAVDTRDSGRVCAVVAVPDGQPVLEQGKKGVGVLHGLRCIRVKWSYISGLCMVLIGGVRELNFGSGWSACFCRAVGLSMGTSIILNGWRTRLGHHLCSWF